MAASKSLMVESIGTEILICFGPRLRGSVARDRAIQLAAFECDVDAIALLDGRRVADDRSAIRVPADGVAAAENGEGAEALETSGRRAEAPVRGMHTPID